MIAGKWLMKAYVVLKQQHGRLQQKALMGSWR